MRKVQMMRRPSRLDRVLDYRKSLPQTARHPFRAFDARVRRPLALLRFVEKANAPSPFLLETRRMVAITYCAAFEVFWRTYFHSALNAAPESKLDLNSIRDTRFTFDDLQTILNSRVTMGELLTLTYSFQGPDSVFDFCHNVLAFGLEEHLGKMKAKVTLQRLGPRGEACVSESVVASGVAVLRDVPAIRQCFRVRNEAAHGGGTRYRPTYDQMRSWYDAMCRFNMMCWYSIEGHLKGERIKMRRMTFLAHDFDALLSSFK